MNTFHSIPSFPDEWAKNPIPADGTLDTKVNKDALFGIKWLDELTIRSFVMMSDLVVRFAQQVAAQFPSTDKNKFVTGELTGNALETMIVDLVAMTVVEKLRKSESEVGKTLTEDIRRQVTSYLTDVLQRAISGRQVQTMEPAAKQSIEIMLQQAFERQTRPAATAPLVPPQTVSLAQTAAPAATYSSSHAPTYGMAATPQATQPIPIGDERVWIAYAFVRGQISEAELKAARILAGNDRADQIEQARKMFGLLRDLEQLLNSHDHSNWYSAPFNTGAAFLHPTLVAAVNEATQFVLRLGKPVHPMEMMTNEDVYCAFAKLTATFIAMPSALRYQSGAGKSIDENEKIRKRAAFAFKRLERVRRTVNGAEVLVWTFPNVKDMYYARMETGRELRDYQQRTHMYYTDAEQMSQDGAREAGVRLRR